MSPFLGLEYSQEKIHTLTMSELARTTCEATLESMVTLLNIQDDNLELSYLDNLSEQKRKVSK